MERHKFTKSSMIPASNQEVFAWHEQPGAVEKLNPPWQKMEVVRQADSLQVGNQVIFKIFIGPISKTWVAEHVEYDPPRLFADVQRQGPFAYWYHRHRFEPADNGKTLMTDEVDYELPFGWIGNLFGAAFARAQLQKMFDYRHQVVLENFKN